MLVSPSRAFFPLALLEADIVLRVLAMTDLQTVGRATQTCAAFRELCGETLACSTSRQLSIDAFDQFKPIVAHSLWMLHGPAQSGRLL